jgi:hypothetical protein
MNGLAFKFGNSQEPTPEKPWFLVIRTPAGTPNIVTGELSTESRYETFSLETSEPGEGSTWDFGSHDRYGTEHVLLGEGLTWEEIEQFMSDLDSGNGEGVTWFE